MTHEQAKELQEAFNHFADGGNLWYYDEVSDRWCKQDEFVFGTNTKANVIEDKNFEARKHFALDGKIEWKTANGWIKSTNPQWEGNVEYRSKPKEPVYEWIFYVVNPDKTIGWTTQHRTEEEMASGDMIKLEESKRD